LLSGKLHITSTKYGAEEKVCQAQFGGGGGGGGPAPPAPAASSASESTPASVSAAASSAAMTGAPAPAGSEGVQGGSKTHTIIVAPTQGVLRFGQSTSQERDLEEEADW